jgi:hypothetical protein
MSIMFHFTFSKNKLLNIKGAILSSYDMRLYICTVLNVSTPTHFHLGNGMKRTQFQGYEIPFCIYSQVDFHVQTHTKFPFPNRSKFWACGRTVPACRWC